VVSYSNQRYPNLIDAFESLYNSVTLTRVGLSITATNTSGGIVKFELL